MYNINVTKIHIIDPIIIVVNVDVFKNINVFFSEVTLIGLYEGVFVGEFDGDSVNETFEYIHLFVMVQHHPFCL